MSNAKSFWSSDPVSRKRPSGVKAAGMQYLLQKNVSDGVAEYNQLVSGFITRIDSLAIRVARVRLDNLVGLVIP